MPRSASTWLYNAAYRVLSHNGACVARGFADTMSAAEPLFESGAEHVLIKSHTPDTALFKRAAREGILLLTVRDPRDAVVSSVDMFGGEISRRSQEISRSAAIVLHCQDLPNARVWRYEDGFHNDASRSIIEIAEALAVRLPPPAHDAIAVAMSRPSVELEIANLAAEPGELLLHGKDDIYHKYTHWHAGHLRDGCIGKWRQLPSHDRDLTNAALQPFVLAWDYETPAAWMEWPVACFNGINGAASVGSIALDQAGYVLFGPYFALPPGVWRLTANLVVENDGSESEPPAILFDVARNGVPVAEVEPTITHDMALTFDFDHDNPFATLEFRMKLAQARPGWRAVLRSVRLTDATHAETASDEKPTDLRPHT